MRTRGAGEGRRGVTLGLVVEGQCDRVMGGDKYKVFSLGVSRVCVGMSVL